MQIAIFTVFKPTTKHKIMKILTTLLLLFFTLTALKAEEYDKYKFGARFNPNMSWLAPDLGTPDERSVSNRGVNFGFSFGLEGNYYFASNYAINTELRITRYIKGDMRSRNPEEDRSEDYSFRFHYVELPVGIRLQTNQFGYFDYFIRFNLVPGFSTSRQGDLFDKNEGEVKEGISLNDDVRFFRGAGEVAMGTRYQLAGSIFLKGSISYNHGFFNIIQGNPENEALDDLRDENGLDVRNHYLGLNLGVLF